MFRKIRYWTLILTFLLSSGSVLSQNLHEYKDAEQHKKFHKRKRIVGAWQINQLSTGAIVVRLKTSEPLLTALQKSGNSELREERKLQQDAINKNISRAFRTHHKFSKVYFIYSNSSDSLLNGARSGIFLDSNMVVDKTINMTENFYLLCEPDYYYSSSIGFLPENIARQQQERGHQVKWFQIIVKNKYGHQLKGPFPYAVRAGGPSTGVETVYVNGKYVDFYVRPSTAEVEPPTPGNQRRLYFPGDFVYARYANAVIKFNKRLYKYQQKAANRDHKPADPESQAFLY